MKRAGKTCLLYRETLQIVCSEKKGKYKRMGRRIKGRDEHESGKMV